MLKRVALAATPQRWRGGLFRRFRNLAARAESASRFAGIDWPHTRAWSEELNYFPSIRVNLKGREPQGQVRSDEYVSFCTALCREFDSWEPIKKAWRRDELYEGDCVGKAPDIIIEPALENGYSHSFLRSRGGSAFRRIRPDEYLGGKERGMTGTHRPNGVLILSKPTAATWARLEDIAPTILAELGVAGPPMDGVSLLNRELAVHEWRAQEQVARREQQDYSENEQSLVEKRLRDLGYFE